MGFLSKIYERRGAAALRQARAEQFAASKAAGTSSPAGTTPAQKAPGSGGAIASPEWASTGAFSSRGKTLGGSGGSAAKSKPGPDPYEFDLDDEPIAAANAGVVPSPALAQRLFELQRRESTSPGDGPPLPPDGLDPTKNDADGTNGDADETTGAKVSRRDEKKRDPSRPAPGKRRRVTFAEVDAYDLPEEESDGEGDGDGEEEEDSDNESVEVPYSDEEDEAVGGGGGGGGGDGDVASSPPRVTIPADAPLLATTPPSSPPERTKGGEDGEPGGGTPIWAKRSLRMTTADTPSPGAKGPAGILKSGPGTVGHGADAGVVPTEMSLSPASSPVVVPNGTSRDVRAERDPHGEEYTAPGTGVNLPESGDDLADLDEAQYALSGLTRNAPAVGKLTAASTLVRLSADPRSRRVLSAQGLAPRLTLAALQLGREARATHRRGAIDRGAGAVPSRLAKLASASLLYLANLDVRASDAAAALASDDAALVLATVLEVTPEEEAEERVKAEEASRRETNGDGTNGGGTNGEATRRDDAKHALARGGFAALLTRGSDDRCERDVSRALRRGLKFLPHEKVDACTLGLLATHRQLVVAEKLAAEAAARATVRQHRRDHPRDKTTRAMDEDEDEDDVDASQREEDEEEEAARLAEDEDDEKVVRGWGNLKERLAASGAMLNVARLADDAAREIHRLGAAVFSRCPDEADEDDESIEADGGGNVESEEEDSKRAAAASRAFARLFRCMRVIESATFGSASCAEAVLDGDLSPAPPSVPGSAALVPMRKNPGLLSPAPKSARKSRGNEDADIADVVGDVRVDGIDMSPPASPKKDDGGDKRKRATNDPAGADDEDEEALLKKFKTAEALLLTPSPGAKRVRGGSAVETQPGGSPAVALDADDDAMGSPDPVRKTSAPHDAPKGEQAQTPTFNFRAVAAAVESSIAWLDDGTSDVIAADGRGVGDRLRWTVMHSLLAALPTIAIAAASACHATDAGASVCGVLVRRRGGLGVDPRLASGTLRHALNVLTNLTNENPRGCAVLRTAPGALETAAALVPWCAALEGLIPGAGPSGSARVAAAARSGATSGGKTLGKTALSARGEDTKEAAAAGVDMLNAAMCVLVNASEVDPEVCGALRVLEADAGALEERRRRNVKGGTRGGRKARNDDGQPVRPLGLVELLAGIFVRSGGAGSVSDKAAGTGKAGDAGGDGDENKLDGARQRVKSSEEHAVDGEVTADMLATETDDEREGDGLITQAYSALLTAFLVEGQPALRADVVYVLPEGGLNALASVLERFKTFHENLESISEASHASLTRIIRWLKGGS